MITGIYGHVGSGKSYHAVAEYIIPALQDGLTVITNISGLNPYHLRQLHYKEKSVKAWGQLVIIKDEEVKGFYKLYADKAGSEVIFVIDEIQNFYGSSNYKEMAATREEFKTWLTKSRHSGHSLIYICQVITMVHTDIRNLTETFVLCSKLNFIKFFPSNRYTAIMRKNWKDPKTTTGQTVRKYDPKVYVCYESVDPGVKETKTKSDKGTWIPWRAVLPIVLILLMFGGFKLYRWIFSPKQPDKVNIRPVGVGQRPGDLEEVRYAVDGWYSDGKCVIWLQGAAPVGQSCPDPGRRAGVIRIDSGLTVTVHASALVEREQTGQSGEVGPQGDGSKVGSTPVGGSSLPSGGKH